MSSFDAYKQKVWNNFCSAYKIQLSSVPLFSSDENNTVAVFNHGKTRIRQLLKRSDAMEEVVIREVNKVITDFNNNQSEYDGLIYMMFKVKDEKIVPLYIGKSEKYGRGDNNLSANIAAIEKNKARFCRWGYNNKYHFGDLSAAVFNVVENGPTSKYVKWANALFEAPFTQNPKLKFDVRFWIKAWKSTDVGPWEEFGPTSLTFLEYQLIGVVKTLFPKDLLNKEGVNRGSVDDDN